MKEINYFSNPEFINPISIKASLKPVARCVSTYDCPGNFNYSYNDVYQSIERNTVNNKVIIGYWVKCPKCKKYTYIGGMH